MGKDQLTQKPDLLSKMADESGCEFNAKKEKKTLHMGENVYIHDREQYRECNTLLSELAATEVGIYASGHRSNVVRT